MASLISCLEVNRQVKGRSVFPDRRIVTLNQTAVQPAAASQQAFCGGGRRFSPLLAQFWTVTVFQCHVTVAEVSTNQAR